MPDTGASRKPQIEERLIQGLIAMPVSSAERNLRAFCATASGNLGLKASSSPSLCCVCRKLQ
jgi:hypothetical protein